MRITLNLIHLQIRRQRQDAQARRRLLLVSMGAAAVLAVAYALLWVKVAGFEREVQALDREIATHRAGSAQAADISSEVNALRGRRDALLALKAGQVSHAALLTGISRLVPEDVWFDRLTVGKGQLIVDGASLSQGSVARLMRGLRESPFVASVDLQGMRRIEVGARPAYQFHVISTLRAGRSP